MIPYFSHTFEACLVIARGSVGPDFDKIVEVPEIKKYWNMSGDLT